mgnify:CR=1 FL=1
MLRGEAGETRDWIYGWYERNGVREQARQWVRNQRYKLYADGSFYDVSQDLLESEPLADEALTSDARAARVRFESVLHGQLEITHRHDPIQNRKREITRRESRQ